MKPIFRVLFMCLFLSSCRSIIGDCTQWADIASKTHKNAEKMYILDSASYTSLEPFLNRVLLDSIKNNGLATWGIDSLYLDVKDIAFRNKLAHFFKKNQLEGGSLIDNNTVFFYYSNGNTVVLYDSCDTLIYELVYLKNDTPLIYSGNSSYMNDRLKWLKIADHWYLRAGVGR